jgi:hypothetical protein
MDILLFLLWPHHHFDVLPVQTEIIIIYVEQLDR